MDALRSHRRPVTASRLAVDLCVSVRTIYRDVQALVELGAPIDGEAGLGYVLRKGFFLPPLMFGEEELEALVLGARWVQRQGDDKLAAAAVTALAKIATASPKDLRDDIANAGLWAPSMKAVANATALRPVREAIREEKKLKILYMDENGAATARVIWPIALAFFERKQLVVAWCELRSSFRHFRPDRITDLQLTQLRYPTRRVNLVKAWRSEMNITAADY
jgi:predicted DNA-binding transcriptional regulator YafY